MNQAAVAARQITLSAIVRSDKNPVSPPGAYKMREHEGRRVLSGSIRASATAPAAQGMFPPGTANLYPLACQIYLEQPNGSPHVVAYGVSDIELQRDYASVAPMSSRNDYPRDTLLQNSRLEIPDEGVLLVNLRVRKAVEFSRRIGQHHLRVGCEFVGLPGSRLAMIERYITRIERERTAKISGLAD